MYRKLLLLIAVLFIVSGLIVSCSGEAYQPIPKADAVAVLMPTAGNTISGSAIFAKTGQVMRVIAEVSNLSPGSHGFHIHAFGDCRASDGSSAGGHFNPDNSSHGAPNADPRHVGDLGNIVADESGAGKLDILVAGPDLKGTNSIIGRSVIVHADPDDMKTQPTGKAGARLACGVIGIAR